MGITHVNTQSATQANASSITATKPTGTASGDVLLAFFTSNNQTCSPPSGWTLVFDDVTEVFRHQMFYKVAGGSEPSNYSFTVGSAASPLILVISGWRGVDTSVVFDIPVVERALTTTSEPLTTPTASGGGSGRLMYLRTSRVSGSTPTGYTESGGIEDSDTGIFSGGSVCYTISTCYASSDYSSGGSKSGLAYTADQTTSHNIIATWALKSTGVPGTMGVSLPSPLSVDISGSMAIPGTINATLPQISPIDIEIWNGTYTGPLAVTVPISMDIEAASAPQATLATVITPVIGIAGETRRFGTNVIEITSDTRWLIVRQDDIFLAVSRGSQPHELVPTIVLPSLTAQFAATTPINGPTALVTATALQPTVKVTSAAGHAAVSCHN